MADCRDLLLVGVLAGRHHYHRVRNLTEDEVQKHQQFKKIVNEVSNRLKLFRFLETNYLEWSAYLKALLSPDHRNVEDEKDGLDRLLLNYLTCAYTIREHFKVSYRQRYRGDAAKLKEYEDFRAAVCKQHFGFAFFLDFRGFVQHKALPVGHFSKQVNLSSVKIEVTQDAVSLLRESREWEMCGLTANHGILDLPSLLQDFHLVMMKSYAEFVVRTMFPELLPAAEFYSALTEEVKAVNPDFRMVFLEGPLKPERDGSIMRMNLQIVLVPNDVLAELGIQVSR
jgi:hypothetical protein